MKPLLMRAALALTLVGPSAARATPLISEVFYDASGADDGLVFVELYGAAGTSLEGWVVEGINGSNGSSTPTLTLTGSIPSDGFFVVGDDRGDGQSNVPETDLVLDFDFQNGPDSVVLRFDAAVLDAVGYGAFGPDDVFAGEGTPAPDAPAGSSLARVHANVDSDDNAADFEVLATPTPGAGPLSPIPEPGTASLLAFGLAALAHGRRRVSIHSP